MMSSGSRRLPQTGSAGSSSQLGRRLSAEWETLVSLARINDPQIEGGRLVDLSAGDLRLSLRLRGTPALALPGSNSGEGDRVVEEHLLRVVFPVFFPAAPMEVYLETPMQHPNIHPETGFVCVWAHHRVSNTVEHALHKTVAMLGWRLSNAEPVHVMQPEVMRRMQVEGALVAEALKTPPLRGLSPEVGFLAEPSAVWRRRLS